jgi:hypothetical protein
MVVKPGRGILCQVNLRNFLLVFADDVESADIVWGRKSAWYRDSAAGKPRQQNTVTNHTAHAHGTYTQPEEVHGLSLVFECISVINHVLRSL